MLIIFGSTGTSNKPRASCRTSSLS